MAHFEPKEPGGVPNPGVTPGRVSPVDDGSNVPWWGTPATSHIARFKYLDIRLYPFLKRFPGRLGPVSLLYVTFRDEKTGGLGPTYQYGFADPNHGQAICDEMKDSPHPYSACFFPKVRKAGIPYTRD